MRVCVCVCVCGCVCEREREVESIVCVMVVSNVRDKSFVKKCFSDYGISIENTNNGRVRRLV